ncbi:MAG: ATP synthase F0 subunit B, partial [Bacteroidales bacterium]|nr:ATP synthase F0 subunit B [Candidatus Equimonas enterica]
MDSLNLPSILTPDFGLLFWMLLAFVVVFFVLAKFGFPAITKMVEERKQYIDDSLRSAREANEKLAGIQAESEKLLREAREKQADIIKEAMATRDAIVK